MGNYFLDIQYYCNTITYLSRGAMVIKAYLRDEKVELALLPLGLDQLDVLPSLLLLHLRSNIFWSLIGRVLITWFNTGLSLVNSQQGLFKNGSLKILEERWVTE